MQKPEDVLDKWTQAWNTLDADALADLFDEDAEFVNVVGLWWHNRADIREAHQYGFDHIFSKSKIWFSEKQTRLIGESAAVIVAKWSIEGQHTPGGGDAEQRSGIFTFVLEKFDSEWLVVAAQNTDLVRGASSLTVVDGVTQSAAYDAPTPSYREDPRPH